MSNNSLNEPFPKRRQRKPRMVEQMHPLTRTRFERLLKKAAQPKKESALKESKTLGSHPSDGCSVVKG